MLDVIDLDYAIVAMPYTLLDQESLERELPRDAAFEPTRRLFLELRHKAIRYDVPIPRFTDERHVQRYVEIQ